MKKPKSTSRIVFIVLAAVVVISLSAYAYIYAQPTAVPSGDVESEMVRLVGLAGSSGIQPSDLSQLRSLLSGNGGLEHEMEELEALVKYGEQQHAAHTIAFMDAYLKTGKQISCPEHELAHFYVFAKHGESELAEHALLAAEEELDFWEPAAREFDEKYPSGISFDDRLADIRERMAAIRSGSSSVSDEESLDLANRAICVDSDHVVDHSSHDVSHEDETVHVEEEGHADGAE